MNIRQYHTGPLQVNTYLVSDEDGNAFIVDPGAFSTAVMNEIQQNDLKVEYIILTHGHCDHIGGVDAFKEKCPGAKVLAHAAEKEYLEDARLNCSFEFLGRVVSVKPDVLVNDGEHLSIGSMDLEFRHTPGHSPGGMCIVTGDVCFSGDSLFQGSIGRTDFEGGSFPQLLDSIRTQIYTLPDDTVVYPGHMGITTVGNEKRYNPFVRG